ncbi:MAG: VCBS repeat-containing protein [Caldilineaceae bacterium]
MTISSSKKLIGRLGRKSHRSMRLVLGLLLCLLLFPQPAAAQTPTHSDAEIIFIDGDGFIRVLDTTRVGSNPLVEWVSPTPGWRDIAVGDFNNDGDAEIAAIGGDATNGKLAVYDPVVASGAIDPSKVINGIPWATLYETSLPGKPTLIAAGNLNPNIPGDELVYGYELNANEKVHPEDMLRLVLLQTAKPDARQWEPQMAPHDFTHAWTQMVVGELDGHSGAEIVLVDSNKTDSDLSVYRVTQDLTRIYDYPSNDRTWYSAALGQFKSDDLADLAAVRKSPADLASLVVLRYDNSGSGSFKDVYGEYFSPPPLFDFYADVNGDGDDEIFMLRSLPTTITNEPHLFMRNLGNNRKLAVNIRLDTDNGYQVGAGGDLDGNGLDDVVIMRNNRIRIYPDIAKALSFQEYNFSTNSHSLKTADVDAKGFVHTPLLTATLTQVTAAVDAGLRSQPSSLTVTDGGTSAIVPFAAYVDGNPSWVTVSPAVGQTPATLTVNFDARALSAGQYTANLIVKPVAYGPSFSPLPVALALTVNTGLAAQPAETILSVYPCTTTISTFTAQVAFTGPAARLFTARVLTGETGITPEAPWVTAISYISNTLPAAVVFTIDPNKRSAAFETAHIHAETTDSQNPTVPIKRDFPFDLLCVNSRLYLPYLAR